MPNLYRNWFHCVNRTAYLIKRTTGTRAAQTVFIEKVLEDPVIVINEQDNVDLIGPPDPVSNLRPIIRKCLLNETASQQRLREAQDETQMWNQNFWSHHNTKFLKERQEYIDSQQIEGEEKRQVSADEMSEFYKRFLDDNWRTHVKYNIEWYKRNYMLLFMALRVDLERKVSSLIPKFF